MWYLSVAPKMKGLASAPNGTLANRRWYSFPCRVKRNRKAFLSSSFIPVCRNAFLISPSCRFSDILDLIIMSHRRGWRDGPVYMHSFILAAKGWGLALASNTILTFVVTASVRTTALCGNRILVPLLVCLGFFRLSLLLAVLQLCVCTQPLTVPFVLVSYSYSVSVSGFVLHWFHLVLLPVSKECLPRTFRRVSLLCSLWIRWENKV